MSSDLTFFTNESGKTLRDRFSDIFKENARFFDCLFGYFFISGFYKLYPALENVEKIRILIGLQTDRSAYELLQKAKELGELPLQSHAAVIVKIPDNVPNEFENSADSTVIETGVRKFVEWVRSGKLEIKAYPDEAFRLSIERFMRSYDRFNEEFHKGNVYISKKHINKIFELLETDDQEAIDRLLDRERAEWLAAKDFNADFLRDLESDHVIPSGRPFLRFSAKTAFSRKAKSLSAPNPRRPRNISINGSPMILIGRVCFSPAAPMSLNHESGVLCSTLAGMV